VIRKLVSALALPAFAALTLGSIVVAQPAAAATPVAFGSVVPAPVTSAPTAGVSFTISASTTLYTEAGSAAARAIATQFAVRLRASTGLPLPIADAPATLPSDAVAFMLSGAPASVGTQGYQLDVTASQIVVRANQAAGLFAGVQTLRQLLPVTADATTVQPGPWPVPGGHIVDYPRFAQRGMMLDVARHFFPVATVERLIDQIALYKINRLHLHLSDDQGWRIAISSWPNLATIGGSTAVSRDPGGYYTAADYTAIVNYAADRYITVIPEIDMPGHTNAALASYASLNCDGVAPPLYTGTNVGFSSLCVPLPLTYTFLNDVIGELAALTPGPYLHIGGDEASSTTAADYTTFMDQAQQIVAAHGKAAVGWHDIVNSDEAASTVAQYWGTTTSNSAVAAAVANGTKVIMSPANKAYLDMKYVRKNKLGQTWAGLIEVDTAYGWNPGAYLTGVGESSVLGVEAPLWTETIRTAADIDFMTFPRLPAYAELGWSPWTTHDWTGFQARLGAQGPRWKVMGIAYYQSPKVSWPSGS
jgi:hexosaminidase